MKIKSKKPNKSVTTQTNDISISISIYSRKDGLVSFVSSNGVSTSDFTTHIGKPVTLETILMALEKAKIRAFQSFSK